MPVNLYNMESVVGSVAHLAVNFSEAPYTSALRDLLEKCGGDEPVTHDKPALRAIFESHGKPCLKDAYACLKKSTEADAAVGHALDSSGIFDAFYEQYKMRPVATLACFSIDYLHNHSADAKEACRVVRENVLALSNKTHRAERLGQILGDADDATGKVIGSLKTAVGSMAVATKKTARIDSMIKMAGVVCGSCRTLAEVSDTLQAVLCFLDSARGIASGDHAPADDAEKETPPASCDVDAEEMNLDASIEQDKPSGAHPVLETDHCEVAPQDDTGMIGEPGGDDDRQVHDTAFVITRQMITEDENDDEFDTARPMDGVLCDNGQPHPSALVGGDADVEFDARFNRVFYTVGVS